jgi:DNA-binding response OmpR family regulator
VARFGVAGEPERRVQVSVMDRPRLVLLAEDDDAFRHLIASILAQDGYEVLEAADGLGLLANIESTLTVRRERADGFLVVTDVRMPGLSGLDVLAILRCANRTTPVILITAFGDEATHAEGRELGAAAIFNKPFDVEKLRSTVLETIPPW